MEILQNERKQILMQLLENIEAQNNDLASLLAVCEQIRCKISDNYDEKERMQAQI